MTPPTSPRGAVGACGSGKSYLLRALTRAAVSAGWRVTVCDLGDEWKDEPDVIRVKAGALPDQGAGLHVVVPPVTVAGERPLIEFADALATDAVSSPGTILVLPEAHLSVREGWPVPGSVLTLVTRHRHVGSGLWWDTQHPARVSKIVMDDVGWLHCFHSASPRDRAALAKWDARVDELLPVARERSEQAPGWHVLYESYGGSVRLARWDDRRGELVLEEPLADPASP